MRHGIENMHIIDPMTTRFKARFDGSALIPVQPVNLPTGALLDVEVAEPDGNATAERLRQIMREEPHIPPDVLNEMDRVIEEGKVPARYESAFDEE
jgi:hypothetical protein